MSDKLIESFLKYEEQRNAQKNPNEFQNVKNLQEKVTRITASGGANTAQQSAGAGTGYTGGPQANTPVSTTTLSDFPSIENATKIFGKAGLNPVGSIASGIGAAARSVADGLFSSDEPRRQFPTPEAMRPTPAPGEGSVDAAAASAQRTPTATPANGAGTRSITATPANGAGTRSITATPTDATPTATPGDGEGSLDAAAASAQRTPTLSQRIADRANREAATQDITNPATPARPNDGNNRVSAPSQATLNTRPGLKAGPASADTIKALQSHLGITADGIAGPQTRQAVMQFQRDNDLQVDGIIGDQTRMALERSIRMRNQRNESVQFSEAELAHFKSILEAMPVAPTAEGHGPNPTPKNKAEGGKGRGSLSEKMDPVGEEDEDVDNDGKVDKSDEYLRKRRAAIAANIKKK